MPHAPVRAAGRSRRWLPPVVIVGATLMLLGGPTAGASAAGPPCPADSTYNKDSRMCEAPPVPTCASGYTLNASGVCARPATQACPQGSPQGGVCVGPPPTMTCPSGGFYDPTIDRCVRTFCSFGCSTTFYQPTRSCVAGFAYNPATRRCERPTSPACTEGTFNAASGQCEVPATPTCAEGFTVNTETSPAVCQAPPLRGRSTEDHGTGSACPDESPNNTGTPPNCGKGRGGI